MKKKGFTLVELLAVIVILAIIALIAIPLIGNVIEKAKIGALESSVNGLVESANMYYANNTIKGETISETTFDFEDGKQISDKKLEYKGKVYNGKLILHASGEAAVCIDDTEHYAYKNKDSDEIISGVGTCKYDGTTGEFSSNSPTEELEKQIASTTAEAKDVLEGKTIYKINGIVTGTMADKSGTTTSATNITESEDGLNAIIKIPEEGHYDETSEISVPISTIQNGINSLNNKLSATLVAYSSSTGTYKVLKDGCYILAIASNATSTAGISNHISISTTGEVLSSGNHKTNTPIYNAYSYYAIINAKAGDTITYNSISNDRFVANVYLINDFVTFVADAIAKDATATATITNQVTNKDYIAICIGNAGLTISTTCDIGIKSVAVGHSSYYILNNTKDKNGTVSVDGGNSYGASYVLVVTN